MLNLNVGNDNDASTLSKLANINVEIGNVDVVNFNVNIRNFVSTLI